MTPLEEIKKGIQTDNMKLVASGYNRLTSETVEPKKKDKPKKERIKASVDDFRMQVMGNRQPMADEDGRTFTRSEPVNLRKIKAAGNVWDADTESFKQDTIEQQELVKKHGKVKPKPRQKVNLVAVDCIGCNKTFQVAPETVLDKNRYICNGCIIRRAG